MAASKKAIALIGFALLPALRASAEPAPVVAPAPAASLAPAAAPISGSLLQKLQSSDAATLQAAIAALMQHKSAATQAALVARLHDGLPPQLCAQAIDALVVLKVQSAVPVLAELLQHRRIDVRARALAALAALAPHASSVQRLAIAALEDPAPEVQTAAVDALVAMRANGAVPALLGACDRGVVGAFAAVGTLGGAPVVAQLLGRTKDGVIDPLLPAFDRLLARADFPLEPKRELIRKLGKLASPSAQRYLVSLGERLKVHLDPKLQQELSAALQSPPAQTQPARLTAPANATVAVKRATP